MSCNPSVMSWPASGIAGSHTQLLHGGRNSKRISLCRRPCAENLRDRQLLATNVFHQEPITEDVNDDVSTESFDVVREWNELFGEVLVNAEIGPQRSRLPMPLTRSRAVDLLNSDRRSVRFALRARQDRFRRNQQGRESDLGEGVRTVTSYLV